MKTFNEIINNEKEKDYFKKLMSFIDEEYKNKTIFPPYNDIFNAFKVNDLNDIKVVILGQDPYHEKNQANGLAFSVAKGIKKPPSLNNIYKELYDDLNIEISNNGDLTSWSKQGVLLLNTVLTVEEGKANSHKDKGWEIFTDHIIEALNNREKPLVFILWGKQAQNKVKKINDRHFVIKSAHPSPLSAYRGFFGSKPFSKTNEFLKMNHIKEIDWRIE